MGICYIVGAGECAKLPMIEKGDFVIAADGGFDSLMLQNIVPNLLVGDLDSIQNVPTGVEILRSKPEKDETDMYLAFLEGVKRKYCKFEIYGGTGGRADHSFANYSLLLYAAKLGIESRLVGTREVALVTVNGSVTLPLCNVGKYFSVFAFGGIASGVFIKNAKYEIENAELSPEFPLGVSNEFRDTPPTVSVKNGAVLIIFEKNS
jgi:thiamine pyrophosphokinase